MLFMNEKPVEPVKPEAPVSLRRGEKCSWLCVRADSSEEVIDKLGLKNPRVCGWSSAADGETRGIFVSPVLDGYVLVVDWEADVRESVRKPLDEAARSFSELQFFSFESRFDAYEWARYINGKMVRAYGFCGETLSFSADFGELTSEELELRFDSFPKRGESFDPVTFIPPLEKDLFDLAAAWGIDASFTRKTYPESTGFICDV